MRVVIIKRIRHVNIDTLNLLRLFLLSIILQLTVKQREREVDRRERKTRRDEKKQNVRFDKIYERVYIFVFVLSQVENMYMLRFWKWASDGFIDAFDYSQSHASTL